MKTISSWHDLEPFGVIFLTAESCALSYRYLCDLTAKGRKILIRTLGVPDISLSAPGMPDQNLPSANRGQGQRGKERAIQRAKTPNVCDRSSSRILLSGDSPPRRSSASIIREDDLVVA